MVCLRFGGKAMTSTNNKAVIQHAGNDFFIGVTPSGNALTVDTNSERASAATPMELLLIALGSCTAVDVIGILRKKRERVTDYRVEVRGERRDDHPRSYKRLEVRHILTGKNISANSVAKAIELSERTYCSVAATLRPSADVVSSYEIIEDPD